jgi:hypothetical protein
MLHVFSQESLQAELGDVAGKNPRSRCPPVSGQKGALGVSGKRMIPKLFCPVNLFPERKAFGVFATRFKTGSLWAKVEH